MEERKQAELKDRILKYLMENENTETSIILNHIPKINTDVFEEIISELVDLNLIETVARTKSGHRIKITYKGSKLLYKGGFMEQYESEDEAENTRRILELEEQGRTRKRDEHLELNTELTKQELKTHWIPIFISIIGLGIAIASYFRPYKVETDVDILKRIEKLETNQKQFKKANDSLKNELYKAELVIRVYEES